MLFSIIVPCYNEAENIPLILERFNESIGERNDIEVILVNNGSTDDSAQVLDKLIPRYHFAETVLVDINRGYGFGILRGLRAAKGDFIGWTHADMQTDPADVIKAIRIIIKHGYRKNIYVKGSRRGRSISDTFFTIGMSVFETLYLQTKLNDINAQPNMFSREFFKKWKNPPYDFSLDLYAMYMAKKCRCNIIRFPVEFPERIHGHSKWNIGFKSKIKFIKRTVNFSRELKRKGIS